MKRFLILLIAHNFAHQQRQASLKYTMPTFFIRIEFLQLSFVSLCIADLFSPKESLPIGVPYSRGGTPCGDSGDAGAGGSGV